VNRAELLAALNHVITTSELPGSHGTLALVRRELRELVAHVEAEDKNEVVVIILPKTQVYGRRMDEIGRSVYVYLDQQKEECTNCMHTVEWHADGTGRCLHSVSSDDVILSSLGVTVCPCPRLNDDVYGEDDE
jgi:hypothetical protein